MCTLPRQCRPPSPRRRWRCDRSSYKRSLFSRIWVSPRTTSLGLRPLRRFPSPPRICVESNHSGMGKPIVRWVESHLASDYNSNFLLCKSGEGSDGRGGRGQERMVYLC